MDSAEQKLEDRKIEKVGEETDADLEIKKEVWDYFVGYYKFIGKKGFSIKYPNFGYHLQGIVPPRQIIAWRKLIKIIGVDVFIQIPLALNYNFGTDNKFFRVEYDKHFTNSGNLNITFTCGYFWKFVKERRNDMFEFVKDRIKSGCNVNIFTQDKDLRKDINLAIGIGRKLYVGRRTFRMDIHSTIVEPKNKKEKNKTLLFIELPHTERTDYRLEAYVTIGQLKEFGCTEKKINKLLRFLKRQRWPYLFMKSIPSKLNLALNWSGL